MNFNCEQDRENEFLLTFIHTHMQDDYQHTIWSLLSLYMDGMSLANTASVSRGLHDIAMQNISWRNACIRELGLSGHAMHGLAENYDWRRLYRNVIVAGGRQVTHNSGGFSLFSLIYLIIN